MLNISLSKLSSFLLYPCLVVFVTSCGDGNGTSNDTEKKEKQISQTEGNPQQKTLQQPQSTQTPESKQDISINFDDAAFAAFETCKITDSFLKTREKIIKNGKPIHKSEGYLTYKLNGVFSGLPFKKIIFGACSVDKPLQKDCSFVEEVAFIFDVDFDKAKVQLKADKGIDFSVVKRAMINGEEEGATLRPVLYQGNDGSTVLHCDTGGL